MNPNLCNSKPYSARIAQKARPKYNRHIFKQVFMLKCELAYSTRFHRKSSLILIKLHMLILRMLKNIYSYRHMWFI